MRTAFRLNACLDGMLSMDVGYVACVIPLSNGVLLELQKPGPQIGIGNTTREIVTGSSQVPAIIPVA